MQLTTVWAAELSCFKSDDGCTCQAITYHLTDDLAELDDHPNTSVRMTKAAQKWFEGFQAFCCTLDLCI